jgi:predicted PurR-regulated permease PerM
MESLVMQQKYNNSFFILIVGLVLVGLVYFLSPILTPFLAAALIAYFVDPLVNKMTNRHVPRLLSVIVVFLVSFTFIVVLFFLLILLIQNQIIALVDVIPKILTWFQTTIFPWIVQNIGIQDQLNIEMVKTTLADNLGKAGGVVNGLFKTVLQSGVTLIEWLTNLLLIPVVTFYLLRDWKMVLKGARNLLPRSIEPTVVKLASECDSVLSAFFRGQLLVMLSLGIIYSVGLTAVGLQIGLIIGFISGLVSIVPYLGFIVGIIAASIAAYVQFGTLTAILLVWLVYGIGQALESMFLTPTLVGDRIGIHPVAVIFAILAGGSLFGFFGVLLALPAAAVIMVWLRFLNQRYHASRLYKS